MSATSSSPEIVRNRLLWEDSSDDSSDSGNENQRIRLRAPRNFSLRLDHFERWSDEEFRIRFRLSKETVLVLAQKLQNDIAPKTERNHAITVMQQILLVLRFCATGCMLQTLGGFAGIHKSTASQIVKKVICKVASLASEYISMPNTQQEIDNLESEFYTLAKFPCVIGAIDCTHIKIISPGGANAECFKNKKGHFSLNVQVVGDANLRIRDIVAHWPGSTCDQTIFNNSSVKARFEGQEFGNSIILGDSEYVLKKYLITPILNPATDVEQFFNESQIRSRNPIEKLFVVLRRRFPILSVGIRLSLDTAKAVIIGCAVLHNIAINMNEPDPINDPNIVHETFENNEIGDAQKEQHNFREEFLNHFMNLLDENIN